MCTGTLVAPQVVITAAHCLHDPRRKQSAILKNIHFVAGVHRDRKSGQGTARCLKFPPGYAYRGPKRVLPDMPLQEAVGLEAFRDDLALIVLTRPLDGVTPMALAEDGAIVPGAALVHASYGMDRRFILSVQDNCRALEVRDGVIRNDCDTNFGSSGGPLFTGGRAAPKLAAVAVGVSTTGSVNLATPVSAWMGLKLDSTCP